MKQRPKRRRTNYGAHVLPRFYLKLFAEFTPSSNGGGTWETFRLCPSLPTSDSSFGVRLNVKRAAVMKGYYGAVTSNGQDFEELLQQLEGRLAGTIQTLTENPHWPESRERKHLLAFLGTQLFRSPFTRWTISRAISAVPNLPDEALAEVRMDFPAFYEALQLPVQKAHAELFERTLHGYILLLARMPLTLVRFSGHPIITADAPFVMGSDADQGPRDEISSTWYLFPLSPHLAAYLGGDRHEGKLVNGTDALARAICLGMMRVARAPGDRPSEKPWKYAYRHPAHCAVDELASLDNSTMEAAIGEIPSLIDELTPRLDDVTWSIGLMSPRRWRKPWPALFIEPTALRDPRIAPLVLRERYEARGLRLATGLDPHTSSNSTSWTLELSANGVIKVIDGQGQTALVAQLQGDEAPWVREVQRRRECAIYVGSGLQDTEGRMTSDSIAAAGRAGLLLTGLARLIS